MGPGAVSPSSSRSAINRNRSACTAAVACFRFRPYAVTPGSAAITVSSLHVGGVLRDFPRFEPKIAGHSSWLAGLTQPRKQRALSTLYASTLPAMPRRSN